MDLKKVIIRQKIIDSTRHYFQKEGYQELDPPTLHPALPIEQNLYSFKTKWSYKSEDLYMSVSPEIALKKALAAGIGNCFSISKCFRNLEDKGIYHNPEFTMLEWYTLSANYLQTAEKTANLINYIYEGIDKKIPDRVDYRLNQLFQKYAAINLDDYLVDPNFNEPDFNQLFLNYIEPHLEKDKLVFLFDYPQVLSPLATPILDTPYAQRFEVYLAGIEIGNGNTENTDSHSIQNAMESESARRLEHNLPTHPIDYDFIKACGQLPPCSGIGLGLDRLAMIISNSNSIQELYSI